MEKYFRCKFKFCNKLFTYCDSIDDKKKIRCDNKYFIDLGKRRDRGVFFYRINGYNQQIHDFICRYYEAARLNGVIIEGKLQNPDNNNLAYYGEIMGMSFQMDINFIRSSLGKWLPRMTVSQRENVAGSIYNTLSGLRAAGKNDNMLKNAYIKFMCWLYYKFERIVNHLGDEKLPKILYEGNISNYELLLMDVLTVAGCDIVLLQYKGDADYLKVDADSSKSFDLTIPGMTAYPADFNLKRIRLDIQEAIKVVAETAGCELIDFHTPLYPYPWHLPDAIHPDEVGYGILAKTVYSRITGDYGGLAVSPLYTDNMVIQRRRPIVIEGTSNAGDKVTVKLGRKTLKTAAGLDGKWCVEFPSMEAATGLGLTISTKDTVLEYSNIAIGELWLCSGQSNMRFRLSEADGGPEAAAASADPDLRFFNQEFYWATSDVSWPESAVDSVKNLIYFRPAKWETASPKTSSRMSAVGYWFAKELRDSLKVPVGIIHDAVGGSPAEAWIDRNTLEWKFPVILRDWINNDFIQGWARERAAKNISYKKGDKFARHPYEPCYLFESAILPIGHPTLAGVLWYQGESNAHNFEAHEYLFPLLVDSWREWFNNQELPFYYVQLSSLNRPSWPWFRDSQRRLLESRSHLGMAVSSDLGDPTDVHYKDKKPVGERLARLALHNDYGFDLVPR